MACRLGVDSASFTRAAENLKHAAGIDLSDELLRELVNSEGKAVQKAQDEAQLEFDWTAKECLTTQTPDGKPVSRVVGGADGVMSPMVTMAEKQKRYEKARERRKNAGKKRGVRRRPLKAPSGGADQGYKELKLVGMQDQEGNHRLVRVTRKDSRSAGRLMNQMSADILLRGATEKVWDIDGAEWIRIEALGNLPRDLVLILDIRHLGEHVHAARRVVFGESDAAGQAWAEGLMHTVRHEGYEPFWSKLTEKRAEVRSPVKRKALDGLMNYVSERRDMLDYPRYERMGWPIGSGATESMCKALTRRLKGRGMKWNPVNAEAVASLEALEQSGMWDNYWSTQLKMAA